MPSVDYFLVLAALIFVIGALGVCIRRNAIVVFMCVELMFNAGNLAFAAFARSSGVLDGQIAVFFVMAAAAAEAAIGMGIMIALFRAAESVETSEFVKLRW